MPFRSRLALLCVLLALLSIQVLAQSDSFSINEQLDIPSVDDFATYPISVDSYSMLEVTMIPVEGTDVRARILLLNKDGLILLEDLAGNDQLATGARLVAPLFPGEYSVIATLRETADVSSGTFNVDINLGNEVDAELFDLSDERLVEMGYPVQEPRETAEWTIFAYYGADTDLEGAIIEDTNEFEQAGGSDSNVRVIVLLDRTPEYSDIDGDWAGTRLYEIGSDETPEMEDIIALESEPLYEFDELDMGSAETLASFLTWGIQHYPAENYVLSFGSHGAGWRGVIVDESDNDSSLGMRDLEQAFASVQIETGFDQFSLLINDACLMASIEYYDVMQDYFGMSFGSAELVTDPALDMTILTNRLRESVGAENFSLNEVGRELVDRYILEDAVESARTVRTFTESVTDLDEFGQVNEALNAFATIINDNPPLYVPTLTQARANTYTYNRLAGASEQIDLGDFMEQIIFVSTDFEVLIPAAQHVIDALSNVRIYGNAGPFAIERTSYYNIFFPLEASLLTDYFGDSRLNDWEQMLINYFAYSRFEYWAGSTDDVPFHQPQTPQMNITRTIPAEPIANFNLPIAIDIEVQATNVSRGIFYVERVLEDDDKSLRLMATPLLRDVPTPLSFEPIRNQNVWGSGVDLRTITWNAGAYQLTDGQQTNIEFLQQTFDDSGAFFLEGRYRQTEDDEWLNVKVTFTPDPEREFDLRSSTFVSVNDRAGTFGVFEPQPGSQLQVFQTEVDLGDGDIDIEERGNIYEIGEDGLGAILAPVEDGEYILRFRVESFGQDPSETEMVVTVNNSEIDPAWRGQNFIDELGFSAGLPVWWGLDFAESAGTLLADVVARAPRTGSEYPEGFLIAVYNYPGLHDLDEARERYVNSLNRPEAPVSFTGSYEIGGREVYEFVFTAGRRYVQAIATYDAVRDMSLIIAVDERFGNIEAADSFYEAFMQELTFYDEVDSSSSAFWRYEAISIEQSMTIPVDWVEDDSADDWTVYHHPDDSNFHIALTRVPRDAQFDVEGFTISLLDEIAVDENLIRNYAGENHFWQSVQYNTVYGNTTYVGRIYETFKNGQSYLVRVEAPEVTAIDNFNDILNPVVSSIEIEDRYFPYDLLDSAGIRFEISNPIFPENPFWPLRQTSTTGIPVFSVPSPQNDKIVQGFFFEGVNLEDATVRFGDYWESLGHSYQTSNIEFVEIAGQRAIEAEITMTIDGLDWQGRYFMVYSEPDDLTYVLGVRGLQNIPIDDDYVHLRDTIEFRFGNFSLFTSILNRPLYDPEYGIDADVYSMAEPMLFIRNYHPGVDFMSIYDDQFYIMIYYINGADSDIMETISRLQAPWFTSDASGPISYAETTFNGNPAIQIDVSYFDGRFLAVPDNANTRVIVIGVANTRGQDVTSNYEHVIDTLTILSDE